MSYNVKELIPHREPILLVDEITSFEEGKSLTGKRHFPEGDPLFTGHFPGFPILPGVLSVEALAQAGACFVNISKDKTAEESLFFFMSVDNVKFRNPVTPGMTVELSVDLLKHRGDVYKFAGMATSEGKVVAESTFTAKWAAK